MKVCHIFIQHDTFCDRTETIMRPFVKHKLLIHNDLMTLGVSNAGIPKWGTRRFSWS